MLVEEDARVRLLGCHQYPAVACPVVHAVAIATTGACVRVRLGADDSLQGAMALKNRAAVGWVHVDGALDGWSKVAGGWLEAGRYMTKITIKWG